MPMVMWASTSVKKKKFKVFFSLNLRMKLNYLTIKAIGFLTF